MEEEQVLKSLEGVAARLGVRVVYADLKEGEVGTLGGSCRVRGEPRLLIERTAARREKVGLLAEELRRWPLGSVYLPPALRSLLGDPSGADEA